MKRDEIYHGQRHLFFLIFCFLLSLFILTNNAGAFERKELLSPNGKFKAIIIPVGIKNYGRGESRVEILNTSGNIIFKRSYNSADGEHGMGVEKASWTPDSQYFVYSMSSSGGHQAWHFRTHFYSIADHKERLIDDFVGPITAPDFQVKAPDIIRVTGQRKENLEESFSEDVNLSALTKKKAE